MSIKFHLDKLSEDVKYTIIDKLSFTPEVKIKSSFFTPSPDPVCAYEIDSENNVYLPFSYSLHNMQNHITLPKTSEYSKIDTKFIATLRKLQEEVFPEIYSTIKTKGTLKLSFYPGFGKTTLSIFLASKLKLRTVILCHRTVLINQWKESIEKCIENPKIQILKSGQTIRDDAQFIIISACILPKLGWIFKDIGTLIVDEIHTFATRTLSKALIYFTPRYLIGLSATPYRSDGMDKLLDVYFGEECIDRKLYRKHLYYRVQTKLKPDVRKNEKGELIWDSILEWQSKNEARNDMIVDIVKKHPTRHFLILCKRIEQAKTLQTLLLAEQQNVDTLIGNETVFDKKARILIATIQKCGVGFSHDILDALIVASDCEEYFIQYLGRVMRTEEGEPIVFDIVDDHPTLKRHYATRKKIAKESGGTCLEYS
jgi:superfamily II DNA or RNA helicase